MTNFQINIFFFFLANCYHDHYRFGDKSPCMSLFQCLSGSQTLYFTEPHLIAMLCAHTINLFLFMPLQNKNLWSRNCRHYYCSISGFVLRRDLGSGDISATFAYVSYQRFQHRLFRCRTFSTSSGLHDVLELTSLNPKARRRS